MKNVSEFHQKSKVMVHYFKVAYKRAIINLAQVVFFWKKFHYHKKFVEIAAAVTVSIVYSSSLNL